VRLRILLCALVALVPAAAIAQRGSDRSPAGERAGERADRPDRERPDGGGRERGERTVPPTPGPADGTISLLNRCSKGDIFVAVYYWDRRDWIVRGWWGVKPQQTINTGLPNTKGDLYFYAEGAGFAWQGKGTDSRHIAVINSPFGGASDHLRRHSDKREVGFFKVVVGDGGYTQTFSCS
jgi:hypothetical protein